MPRIAESEIDRLKSEISLLEWVRSEGLEPRKRGNDYVVLCPFHDEDTASCVITPSKNLFNCFGCGAGGTIVDWVMRRRGVSFPHAIEILRTGSSGPVSDAMHGVQHIEPIMPMDVSAQVALREVMDFYHDCLHQTPEALAFLEKRGLASPELIKEFRLGYCNRTLSYRLPSKTTKAGVTIRDTLQQAGIYRAKVKYEHFGGCLVVPVIDSETGAVLEAYGRKIRPNHKIGKNEMKHGYLPGPHRGVWNSRAFAASDEIILCEALIDAMTFWVQGFRNVTAIYGTSGFSDDLKRAFEQNDIKRVFLAFDRDEAGDRAAEKYALWFAQRGIEVRRVLFPKGMDANDYALKVQPAGKALDHLLRSAELISEGRGDSGDGGVEVKGGKEAAIEETGSVVALSAVRADAAQSKPILSLAADSGKVPRSEIELVEGDHELHLRIGDRSYRVRGLDKNLSYGALKVNLMARHSDLFHVDTLDLYQARQRAAFVHQASVELGQAEERIKRDLGQILLKLEALQADQIKKTLEVVEPADEMDAEQRKAALDWLKSPNLIENILSDFGKLGVVGEDINVLTGYLAAVSRKLDKPLAIIIQSTSAAGKSALMDAVLTLVPEEERVQYSALTGQSLFYMGETNLKNKILAIAEEEGASNASYALKLLQSEGVITIASTGKDDATGQLVTKEYRVEGPVMLFLTTTAIDIDEELLNRCMVLTVNESRDQTRAIHEMQRQRQTLAGMFADMDRSDVLLRHRTAQQLLRPLKVVNPFAADLSFADTQTRTRRDHMKYLGLISAIALLHQHSRAVKRLEHGGRVIEYIEVIPKDIELANRLSSVVLGRSLDELPPQTRKLLIALQDWIKGRADTEDVPLRDVRFRRREVREALGWTDTMLKIHLGRLAEMEYLLVHRSAVRGGMSFEYELASDGAELGGLGLKAPSVPDPPPVLAD